MTSEKETRMTGDGPGQSAANTEKWLKIELFTPPELSDALADFLTEIGAQGVFQESPEPSSLPVVADKPLRETLTAFLPCDNSLAQRLVAFRAYLDSVAELFPQLEKPGFVTEVIGNPDWGEAWKKYFKPLRVGRHFVVKPTWEPFTAESGDIVIEIDPGMAFGTGQHASTRLCLEAIESLCSDDRNFETSSVLDVGTGTGILGIACAKLGAERVLCVDNDPLATKTARDNVQVNGVQDRTTVSSLDIAALTEPFPLIVANLTTKILGELYPAFVRLVSPGGRLVIAGIIQQDKPDIETRFLGGAFMLYRLMTRDEWVCYILKKAGDPL